MPAEPLQKDHRNAIAILITVFAIVGYSKIGIPITEWILSSVNHETITIENVNTISAFLMYIMTFMVMFLFPMAMHSEYYAKKDIKHSRKIEKEKRAVEKIKSDKRRAMNLYLAPYSKRPAGQN